jgi:probable HAF family extracellular repeat protein
MKSNRAGAGLVFLWAWALMFVVVAVAQAAPPQRWSVVELGALRSEGSNAWTLNNRGDVAGSSTAFSSGFFSTFHAFIWQNGVMTDVGASIGNPSGSANSLIAAINDRGTAVGSASPGEVYVWNDGVPSALGIAGQASGINKSGAIVGTTQTGPISRGGQFLAFLYQDGVMHTLGTLGGDESHAVAINDRGIVAGWSYTSPGTRATRGFIYKDGIMTALPTLGGRDSTAADINNHGVVVGMAEDASDSPHGFMWDERGGMRSIGVGFAPRAINDRGAVIGNVSFASYLYEDGTMTRLDTLPAVQAAGYRDLTFTDINDRGWIAGYGWKGSTGPLAVLLVPR